MIQNESDSTQRTVIVYLVASDGTPLSAGYTWSAGQSRLSVAGGAYVNTTNTPSAIDPTVDGAFQLVLAQAETSTLGPIRVLFTPTGCEPLEMGDTVKVGEHVATVTTTAANTVRDAILNYAFRSGRTVRGWIRRTDAFVTNKVTGLLGVLATFYQPDGSTVEYTAAQDTALGTRQTGTVTNSETP